jgi:hypothetical protein
MFNKENELELKLNYVGLPYNTQNTLGYEHRLTLYAQTGFVGQSIRNKTAISLFTGLELPSDHADTIKKIDACIDELIAGAEDFAQFIVEKNLADMTKTGFSPETIEISDILTIICHELIRLREDYIVSKGREFERVVQDIIESTVNRMAN